MKKINKILSICIALFIFTSYLPIIAYADSYSNTYINIGDQRKDIIGVAMTQRGNRDGRKYNNPDNKPWCAKFVTWCARQAGISEDIIKDAGYATAALFGVEYRGRDAERTCEITYIPLPGDLIFFDWEYNGFCKKSPPEEWGDHVGIVVDVDHDNRIVYTIEGNSDNKVSPREYSLDDSEIKGYGVPAYTSSSVGNPASTTIDTSYPTNISATPKNTVGNTIVYNRNRTIARGHYIEPGDACVIKEVYTDGFCLVSYPTSNGYISMYAHISDFNYGNVNAQSAHMNANNVAVPVTHYNGENDQFSGILSSDYPIASVQVLVYNSNQKYLPDYSYIWTAPVPSLAQYFTYTPKTSIDLKSEISGKINFAGLTPGQYYIKIQTNSMNIPKTAINENYIQAVKEYYAYLKAIINKNVETDQLLIYKGPFTVTGNKSFVSSNGASLSSTSRSVWKNITTSMQVNSSKIADISPNGTYTTGSTGNSYYNSNSSYSAGTYKVRANGGLNTRREADANSAKLSSWSNGATVEVTATDGNWGYTNRGWICLDYTEFISSPTASYDTNVFYQTGNYTVSTKSGLNCRNGAGTGSAIITALSYGTSFSVTEVNGAWGYSPEYNGWLYLQYAAYISALIPALPVPGTPSVSSSTSSVIGVGDVINASWNAVDGADSYKVSLVDAATSSEIQTIDVSNTTASFIAPYPGTFNLSVTGVNYQHNGNPALICGYTAVAPATVTFKDWDGSVLCTQQVAYGKDATLPALPSRTGYTFTSWLGKYTAVREDTTVTATYTRNSYKVTFYDFDGTTVIDTQNVLYRDAATEPAYSEPTGYSFVKWDTDFSCITGDTAVKAIILWSSSYPLEISTSSSIYRNHATYITTAIVNNSPYAVSDAKVIVALKTAEGKQLAEVKSTNMSLAAGEMKTVNLSVDYEGAATVGNIFVVKADDENIPLANHFTVAVDQGTAWSGWSTSIPPASALKTQSRTEYRYRDKSFTSPVNSTLGSPWIHYNTTSSYSSWSGWSEWKGEYVESIPDLREVKTQRVLDYNSPIYETRYSYKTVYHYYRYATVDADSGGSGSYAYSAAYPYYRAYNLDYALSEYDNNYAQTRYHYWYSSSNWVGVYQCDPFTTQEVTGSWQELVGYNEKTEYSYRTRSLNYTYYYYKWNDWTEWSTSPIDATSDREVQTRTTYRYLSNEPSNIEVTDGEVRNISGNVETKYAGKYALLHISSADGTIQFIGQTKLGSSGEYSFTFKLKNEPSYTSGDYIVTMSIEGTSAAFQLEPILAPVPEYTVTFKNYDGSIIETQTVRKGENAVMPASPDRTGYDFIGWSGTGTNIQNDIVINANFAIKKLDVIFVDDLAGTRETVNFDYGDTLTVPDVDTNEAYDFLGWDAVLNGITQVTENLVVFAKYKIKSFTVTFLDFDYSELNKQTVNYGDAVSVSTLENRDGYVFVCWNYSEDINYVTADMTITPYFEYEETVATPTANITTGTYNGEQTVTLSCNTVGASIYYTTDGTYPLIENDETVVPESSSTQKMVAKSEGTRYSGTLYTGPFVLDRYSVLSFVAVKDGMNASDKKDEILVINTSSSGNAKYTVTVHNNIYDYENLIIVDGGQTVTLSESELENYGYTLAGVFTDPDFKNAWNLESDVVNSSMDIFLKWTKNTYTVNFENRDGNIIESQTVEYGDSAIPPMVDEIDGYIFSGWNCNYSVIAGDTTVRATYISTADITTVTLSDDILLLENGTRTAQLTATVKLGTGATNDHVIWQSSNEDVAMVDDSGNITAVSDGEAIIFAVAEDSGMSAICSVKVSSGCIHNYEESITAPTCTAAGYTTYTCTKCGNTYTGNEAIALGHSFGAWIIVTQPTCTEPGSRHKECTVCGAVLETEQIAATSHVDLDDDGYCDQCGADLGENGGETSIFQKLIDIFKNIINWFRSIFATSCG